MEDTTINFIELIALTRITPEATVEKFGSLINSSFFDASNILAGLKMKGLVDFVTAFPNQSTLKLTEKGAGVLAEANKKAAEPVDALDSAILAQLAGGKRSLIEMATTLNVAQKDLALHIFKLSTQGSLTYELVNANVSMFLTERGFVAAKGIVEQPVQQVAPAGGAIAQPAPNGAPVPDEIKILEQIARKKRTQRKFIMIGVVVLVVVVIVALVIVEKIIVL